MSDKESNHPIIISSPTTGWIGGMVATVLIGALGILMLGTAVLLIVGGQVGMSVLFVMLAGVMGVLLRYVRRDAHAKRRWCIDVRPDALALDLPGGRSLAHRLDPVRTQVRFDQIEAIETRLEAYRSFGLSNMNRSYALKLKTGDLIILGEDRALSTGMASDVFANAIEIIGRNADLEIRDLGMVEGRGGIFSVLFTSPPRWDTPSLSAKRQADLLRDATRTGRLAAFGAVVVLLTALMSLVFGRR